MVSRILLIASAACVFNLANGLEELFPGFHPCKLSDGDCILDNAKKGIVPFVGGFPELKVKSLEPAKFKEIDASTPNLKFMLNDIVVTGLKTCKPLTVKSDPATSQMTIELDCDLKLDGHYLMDGHLLLLQLTGNGKIAVSLPKIINKVVLHFFIKEGKDGKKYLRIKNFEHSYELKEKSQASFEGLFQGSDVLGNAADDFIKNNSNEIVQEIGGPVFTACIKEIVEQINKFCGSRPLNELTLESA